ncbi:hypothetical protein WG906_13830 [Pedobacter sp. P351]|uniref:hypothetical protein n=1 Tax=Pedobacter superstes TaxID=3133441 RepID=UPI0030A97226
MTLPKILGVFALITFISNHGFAQQEMLFRIKFLPNKTYSTVMVNDMKMEMDSSGDTVKRNQMEAKGLKLPMFIDMRQEMGLTTRTGSLTADKRIPVTISYDKMGVTMKMNGKEMQQPNKFVGMKIKGHAAEDGRLKVDEIEGDASPEIKIALEKMMSQVLNAVKFPNKAMKIGDTFTQEIPMEMPAGGTSMNMLINSRYVLKEIKGNQAFFDYTQNIALDLTSAQRNSTATGSGTGKMIYDIPANYITETTGDMTMKMTLSVGETSMKINVRAKSSVKASIL